MITDDTVKQVHKLSNGRCLVCGRKHSLKSQKVEKTFEVHHIYWKSQYKGKDRDEAWNLGIVCFSIGRGWDCHKSGPDAPHNNKEIDKKLKLVADLRRPNSEREGGIHKDLLSQRKARKTQYRKNIEAFKEKNGGLSPSQLAYRRQKQYKKDMSTIKKKNY